MTETMEAPALTGAFWTLDRVADALGFGASGVPRGARPLTGISTDTRHVGQGDLFVALVGERFDAHDFLADAVRAGAAGLVVSDAARAATLGVPVYEVEDTTAALGRLARYRRRAWGGPLIAIAGSNGKTSTKALVTAALGARLTVHATAANFNNQIGVPLTLLALRHDADVAVVEMGTNHPGEIATLRAIAEPDVAIVTSIGEEHLEGFGDLAGVLREESAVFAGVSLAITPAAQPEIAAAAAGRAPRVIAAGLDAGDLRADRWGLDGDGTGWLEIAGITVRVPLRGEHNLRNAMLALAVARELGVGVEDAARGIAGTPALSMRMAWGTVRGLTILNDAYNANPASAREAIRVLDALDGGARQKVIVLGSMLELGPTTGALHDEIARLALSSSASLIAGVGEFERALSDASARDPRVVVAPDVPELWPMLVSRLARDSIVLLKGSRGARLERLVPLLESHACDEPSASPDSIGG